MKKILVLLVILSSPTLFAKSVTDSCKQRVIKYKSKITGSANQIIDHIERSEREGQIWPAEDQEKRDAEILRESLNRIADRQRLNSRQSLIVTEVCKLKEFSTDEIWSALAIIEELHPVEDYSYNYKLKSITATK